jgi:ribosomal protein L11 methyltransferase
MNSESPVEHSRPYQSIIELICAYNRDQMSAFADFISDGFYASALERNIDKTGWLITLFSRDQPDEADIRGRILLASELKDMDVMALQRLDISQSEDKNWLEEVHQAFPPRIIGRFFVYGSHYNGPLDPDALPLKIDAATAFGSGEHETTRLCLETLGELRKKHDFSRILDMGCGSGILAIAAAQLWPQAEVTGIDNDAESVRVADRHQEMNGFDHLRFETGDGYNTALAQNRGPYDLVIANILTRPLIAMAPAAAKATQTGGRLVLSGLLERQKDQVITAHEAQGFILESIAIKNNWACLVLNKA